MGEFIVWLVGCLFGHWVLDAEPKNRWLQALQVAGCLLFLFLFVMMVLALTGLLGWMAGD